MTRDRTGPSPEHVLLGSRPCPSGHPDHVLLNLSDDDARVLELPADQPLHVDRSRRPTTGDLVWVEIVRRGSTQRLVRRYALDAGLVTLSAPAAPAIMRRPPELLVLGVVDETRPCSPSHP